MKLLIKDFKPHALEVEHRKANRKTLAISVYPDQSVEVISPLNSGKQEVIDKILKRRRWILKQQRYFRDLQSHEQHNLTITGAELHYLGRQYRLRIITCDQTIKAALHGRYLDVPVENSDDQGMIKKRISDWYRERAKNYLTKQFDRLRVKHAQLNLPDASLRVALMKTRWGSCTATGTITLNPLLILVPSNLIEYVIVHELCHLKHPNHSKTFYNLLTKTAPGWKKNKAALDSFGAKLKSLPSPFI